MVRVLITVSLLHLIAAEPGRDAAFEPEAFTLARFLAQIDGLNSPATVTIDDEHHIHIVESGRGRVLVFDAAGNFVRSEKLDASIEHGTEPARAALPDGAFIATNNRTPSLRLLDADDRPLAHWSRYSHTPHEGRGLLRDPTAIAVAPDGTLMAVCEALEQRCQVFSLTEREDDAVLARALPRPPQLYGPRFAIGSGAIALYFPAQQKVMVIDAEPPHHMITEFGEYGTRFGQFERISDLLIAPGAQPSEVVVAVADDAQHRVSLVRIDREDRDQLGFASVTFMQAIDATALRSAADAIELRLPVGVESLDVTLEGDIRFDDAPRKHLIDAAEAHIVRVTEDGERLRFGTRGSGDGEFAWPTDLAVTTDDGLAVLDHGHQRIIFFDAAGDYVHHFGARKLAPLPEPAWRD